MNPNNIHKTTVTILVVLSYTLPLAANTYKLFVDGEQVTFKAAPELGYVIMPSNKKDSFIAILLEKDSPIPRPAQVNGKIVSKPILGGLHHIYSRVA